MGKGSATKGALCSYGYLTKCPMIKMSQEVLLFSLNNSKLRKDSLASKKLNSHLQNSDNFQLGLQTATQTGLKESTPWLDVSPKLCTPIHASKTNNELKHYKIESLLFDNSQLRSKLEELEKSLQEIKIASAKEEKATKSYGSVGTSATQRIVELSKKNRHLKALLSTEKNKVQQLSNKLKISQETLKDGSAATPVKEHCYSPDVRILNDQLDQCNMRLIESRNQNQILKQELKLAQKVIIREVGDVGINTNSLLSGATGWRGRAQQIINLQNKLADTKKKLFQAQHSNDATSTSQIKQNCTSSNGRQKATLDKLEQEKKRRFEDVQIELKSLRNEYSTLHQQCHALKARNKTLTHDLKVARSKLNTESEATNSSSGRCQSCTSTSLTEDTSIQTQERYCWEIEREKLRKDHSVTKQKLGKCLLKLQHLEVSLIAKTSEPNQVQQTSGGTKVIESTSLQRELDALLKVAIIERDRLLELTQSLQQRLDATTSKAIRLDTDLRNKKCEKKFGAHKKTHSDELGGQPNDESRVSILLNENAVLKETLELTRHEKLEDIILLNSMLQDAKQIFIDSIRKL